MHMLERHILFPSVFTDPSCRFRRQAEQRANRRARVTARTQLHYLSEQHERDNDGCGFEVDADGTALVSE
jgi:hypothetical protein